MTGTRAARPRAAGRGTLGCFLVAATGAATEDGTALLGSVSDTPYDVRTIVKAARHAQGYDYVGAEFASLGDRTLLDRGLVPVAVEQHTCRGVNEAGLAITESGVFEAEGLEGGPRRSILSSFDELLRTCATVDEAIAFVEAFGASSYATCLMLGDVTGTIAQVEAGALGTAVVGRRSPADPGVLVATNCFLSLAGTSDAGRIDNPENNNACRMTRGHELATSFAGRLSPALVARILADHEHDERDPTANPLTPNWGYSICNHGTCRRDEYPWDDDVALLPWGTVSAELFEPAACRLWFSYGWPCGAPPAYGDQLLQERSWGAFVPFEPSDGDAGAYTTPDGAVTALGVRNVARSVAPLVAARA